MNAQAIKGRAIVSVLAGAMLLGAVSRALAEGWENGDRDRGDRDRRDREHEGRWFHSEHYFPFGHELRELPRGVLAISLGGLDYFYFEGLFYRGHGEHYVVVEAPVGAVVAGIPTCKPVIVGGLAYFMINGNFYLETRAGYQVVAPPKELIVETPPVVVAPPAVVQAPPAVVAVPAAPAMPPAATPVTANNTFTVNVPNTKGAYTAVTLTRSGSGFIGPQGEYYTEFPPVEQLKVMYGK